MISKQTTTDVIKVLGDFKLHYGLTHASISQLLFKLGMVKGNKSFSESMIGLKMDWDSFVERDKRENPQHPDQPLYIYLKNIELMQKTFDIYVKDNPQCSQFRNPNQPFPVKLGLMKAFRHAQQYPPFLKTTKECIDKAFEVGIFEIDHVWGPVFSAARCNLLEPK